MINQLLYVKNRFDIEVLAIRDNPRYSFNILESLEQRGIEETTKKMNLEENQKDEDFWKKLEQENDLIHKMDLSKYFKIDDKYQPIIGNVVVYRDNRHLTDTYSKSFGPILEEKIIDILEGND